MDATNALFGVSAALLAVVNLVFLLSVYEFGGALRQLAQKVPLRRNVWHSSR